MSVGSVIDLGYSKEDSEEYLKRMGVRSISMISEASFNPMIYVKYDEGGNSLGYESFKISKEELEELMELTGLPQTIWILKKTKHLGPKILQEERREKLNEIQGRRYNNK